MDFVSSFHRQSVNFTFGQKVAEFGIILQNPNYVNLLYDWLNYMSAAKIQSDCRAKKH